LISGSVVEELACDPEIGRSISIGFAYFVFALLLFHFNLTRFQSPMYLVEAFRGTKALD